MVHRSVLQWTRGERVPLSLYERTFFCVLHFHFMTAFQTRPKRRRVFPFPNNHRRPSKVLLQRLSSLFFLLLVYSLAFPHSFTARQVTNAAGFGVRIGWKLKRSSSIYFHCIPLRVFTFVVPYNVSSLISINIFHIFQVFLILSNFIYSIFSIFLFHIFIFSKIKLNVIPKKSTN